MNTKIFSFIIALIFLTSCQSVRVVTDYDKVAPFKSYKTFLVIDFTCKTFGIIKSAWVNLSV